MATTIQVAEETADELHDRKQRGDTYDDVIRRLLDDREGPAPEPSERREAPQAAESDGGEKIRCEHCGNVWTTRSESQRPTCSQCTRKTDRLPP